jgi:hypothetical protein
VEPAASDRDKIVVIHVAVKSPESYLVLCPWCGDAWARLEGSDQSFWWHRYVPCTNHSEAAFAYGCKVGGSLLEFDEFELIEALPPELIEREFKLTMNSVEIS